MLEISGVRKNNHAVSLVDSKITYHILPVIIFKIDTYKLIHTGQATEEKKSAVTKKLKSMKLTNAARIIEEGAKETLTYYDFPSQHWRSLRTNNPLERLMREIRRRTRVVGAFPDGQSALMLVAARLRHISDDTCFSS